MASYFIQNGPILRVTDKSAINILDHIPAGTYAVKPARGEYILEAIENFNHVPKVYGDTQAQIDRIVSTFLDRPKGTGVLLSGEKGSGKTMISKEVSLHMMEKHGMPILLVNQPLCGAEFNEFIYSIEQPCVIIFDEFEKVYDEPKQQQELLTLLDGVFSTKKLFLMTCNKKNIDSRMLNRPGRIFYALDFEGLTREFIYEYCMDKLDDKSRAQQVVQVSALFDQFNFDMLQAMIQEMNRYKEGPVDVLQYLNTKPKQGDSVYDITITRKDGMPVQGQNPKTLNTHPLSLNGTKLAYTTIMVDGNGQPLYFDDKGMPTTKERGELKLVGHEVILRPDVLKSTNAVEGEYIFDTHKEVVEITLRKVRKIDYSYLNYGYANDLAKG